MHLRTFCFHLQDFDLEVFFSPVKIKRFLGSRKASQATTVLVPTNAREPDATIRLACVEIPLLLCHMRWGRFSTATLKKTRKWTHRWALTIKCRY
ncbi:hypothetical protein BYT27DRAFT_7200077, partial [Phlegmacium glaucopus]